MALAWWQIAICGPIAAFTILGNVWVLLVIICKPSIRSIRSNIFIASLAVTDLVVGAFVMPFNLDYLSHNSQWANGEFLCYAWMLSDTVVSTASIWNLVVIALDRIMAIKYPIHYMNLSRGSAVIAVAAVWTVSLLICLLPPAMTENPINKDYCVFNYTFWQTLQFSLLAFYVPLLIIVASYGIICNDLWASIRRKRRKAKITTQLLETNLTTIPEGTEHANHEKRKENSKQRNVDVPTDVARREHRILLTMSVIVSGFILCWLPFWLLLSTIEMAIVFKWLAFPIPGAILQTGKVLQWLAYSNSMINPIIYALLNPMFRATMIKYKNKIQALFMR